MDEKTLFLKFWEREAPAIRKVISRIPQERSSYKPEPKSRNAREIVWLLVNEERFLVEGLENGKIDWREIPAPEKVQDILAAYDRQHEDLTARLRRIDHELWEKQIPFLYEGQEYKQESGYDFAWEFLFDLVHHRGQLTTYLRPMGSTVPSIYGPSADEPV